MQPNNNNGNIQIRFTQFGYRYQLGKLGKFSDPKPYQQALSICESIQVDIRLGRFKPTNNDELFDAYHPLAKLSSHHEQNTYAVDAITLVQQFLEKKELKDRVLIPVLNLLKTYGKPIKTKDDAQKFWLWITNDGKRSNNSNNLYLATLKPVCPMFKGIKPLKTSKVQKDEKPFTKEEIKAIISELDLNFSYYSPFVKFLFSTGCRPNEATALTWDCVDFEAKTIVIKKAISTAKDGSKVIKATKTDVDRFMPMTEKILLLLVTQESDIDRKTNIPLVFPTPNGQIIDLGNFRNRIWVKALKQANVPYRTIYNTRHTFCSHFLNETPDFLKLASITHGTKSGVNTLIKHYAHVVNKPVMPDMF